MTAPSFPSLHQLSAPEELPAILARLRREPPPGGAALSAYLDLSPGAGLDGDYPLALRDSVKLIRPTVSPEQADAFEAAVSEAERALRTATVPQPGIAIFAARDPAYTAAVRLPRPPLPLVAWAELPVLVPLQQILDEEQRLAIALFDSKRARLFTVWLGSIESRDSFIDEVPTRQATAGWYGLNESRLRRHREQHLVWHARRTVAALELLQREHPFDGLLLSGPPEALPFLRNWLTGSLSARVVGTLSLPVAAADLQILKAVEEVQTRAERVAELRRVETLLEARTSAYVRLGAAGVLDALAEGRVEDLVLAEAAIDEGGVCPTCGRLVAPPLRCPACGVDVPASSSFREQVINAALREGARVSIVRNAAGDLLGKEGGVGAWLRF